MAWSSKPEDLPLTIIYSATPEWPAIKFDGMVTVDLDNNGNITEVGKTAIIEDVNRIKNKVPTHDPYTNPNCFLYYQCSCGDVLDPGVKSFAALNNAASEQGWKIRFTDVGYVPHCVECGKGVE